jgi:malonyl-CoA O-methyltransferase
MNEQVNLSKRFDAIATEYAKHHIVQTEHLQRLIERFEFIKGDFPCILDLGCGPGDSSVKLKKLFPKSKLIAVDISQKMLKIAKSKRPFFNRFQCLQADVSALPLADESVDLIFAHHVLAYLPNMQAALTEWHRVLKPGGGLMLSSFGPDTYKEVKAAFWGIDDRQHTHDFCDLHDIGDALMQQGFIDPVIDRADLSLRFVSAQALLQHLKALGGMINRQAMRKGLMTPRQYQKLLAALEHSLTHELITAHAWRGKTKRKDGAQVITLAELKANLRDSHL